MALAREDKERIVQEVKEVSASASSLVISDARGLKVSELTEIRKQGTESGVHMQVIKNSLAKLAFEGTDFGCTDEVLTGPSLFAFSYAEPGAAAKMLKTYAKNHIIGQALNSFQNTNWNSLLYLLFMVGMYCFQIYQNINLCR